MPQAMPQMQHNTPYHAQSIQSSIHITQCPRQHSGGVAPIIGAHKTCHTTPHYAPPTPAGYWCLSSTLPLRDVCESMCSGTRMSSTTHKHTSFIRMSAGSKHKASPPGRLIGTQRHTMPWPYYPCTTTTQPPAMNRRVSCVPYAMTKAQHTKPCIPTSNHYTGTRQHVVGGGSPLVAQLVSRSMVRKTVHRE